MENLKMKLQKTLDDKKTIEIMYQTAFNSMLKKTEAESKVILDRYFYVKKIRTREKENIKQILTRNLITTIK